LLQGNEQLTMAAGFDDLVDYLLSEIALCGVQGMSDPLHHFFFFFVYSIEHFLRVCAPTLVGCISPSHCSCSLRQDRLAGEPCRWGVNFVY
jgi:hypothetical protein